MSNFKSQTCLIACLAIGVLMLAPNPGYSQVFHNELGIYTDLSGDPATTSINVEPWTMFTIYLVLTNPYNYSFGYEPNPIEQEIALVDAIYCRIYFPETGFFIMEEFPGGPGAGYGSRPDYIYGFLPFLPVPEDKAVMLWQFNCMVADVSPRVIHLGPTMESLYVGRMVVMDGDDPWEYTQDLYPVSGDYSNPVFGINTGVIPVATETFGTVKALYR